MQIGPSDMLSRGRKKNRQANHWPTVIAVAWLVMIGLAYLEPALAHGTKLGPYDLLARFGLGAVRGAHPNNEIDGDLIEQMIPWTTLVWEQVHHGHFPLWNPFNGLGLPLAFNFQSAPFSLPLLVAYLVPVRFAYTVVVILKLAIAGTGAFFLGRVMGLGNLAAAFMGTVFELSGAFTGWLGWPQDGVFCWLGWLLAAALLLLRGEHRARDCAFFAAILAFAVFGGHPESTIISLVSVGTFTAAMVVVEALKTRAVIVQLRAIASVIVAVAAGLALSAPLLLPGLQVLSRSNRSSRLAGYTALPLHSSINLAMAGYFGFPLTTSNYFGPRNYYETAGYVGVIALLLVVVAIVSRRRRTETVAFTVLAGVLGLIIYLEPLAHLLNALGLTHLVVWSRALVPLALALSALSAIGLQAIIDDGSSRVVCRSLAGATVAAALFLILLRVREAPGRLPRIDLSIRIHSFLWPSVQIAAAIAAVVLLLLLARHESPRRSQRLRWAAVGVLVAAELGFLLTAAPDLWSSTGIAFKPTPAELAFEKLVGVNRVGFAHCPGISRLSRLGILPDANSAYGIAEFEVYDPISPKSYFTSLEAATGVPLKNNSTGLFCPSINSAALAREYGVSFIVARQGATAPPGTSLAAVIDGEAVYRVPGAGIVTLQQDTFPAGAATAVPVDEPTDDPATIHFVVDPKTRSSLVIHVTDYPGWTATDNGHALHLQTWDDAMMVATVGPGIHHITLTYRPRAFTLGLLISAVTALTLLVCMLISRHRRRTARRRAWRALDRSRDDTQTAVTLDKRQAELV